MSRRFLVTVEYDGTDFVGWQFQANGRSVQETIERAIADAFNENVRVLGAGRTDSGVHAFGQAAHFDLNHAVPASELPIAINTRLPDDVRILSAVEVSSSFNARRDARSKTYSFFIDDGKYRPAFYRRQMIWTPYQLDESLMNDAARLWLGKHDFSAFRSSGCQADSPVRSIDGIEVRRFRTCDPYPVAAVRFMVTARAFLQNQVRIMAGTLVEIGRGSRPVAWAGEVLHSRQRSAAGPTLPAHGLVLVSVEY